MKYALNLPVVCILLACLLSSGGVSADDASQPRRALVAKKPGTTCQLAEPSGKSKTFTYQPDPQEEMQWMIEIWKGWKVGNGFEKSLSKVASASKCALACAAYNDKPYPAKCGSFSYKPSTKRCNFHRFDSYNGNPDGGNFPSFCKDSAYEAGSVTTN